jgi:hypothetical protein
MVIGGLLLGAILAGNVARAVQSRGIRPPRARAARKEVVETEREAVRTPATRS